MLKIDKKKMMEDFLKRFEIFLKAALNLWVQDVKKYSSHNNDIPEVKVATNTEIEEAGRILVAKFKANAAAMADSFGTGSEMVTGEENPNLIDYWLNVGDNKGERNPSRKTTAIEGRKKGHYTDIFGGGHDTEGKFEGKDIEYMTFKGKNGEKVTIEPIVPSHSIRIANYFLSKEGGTIDKAIKNTIKGMDLSKYIIEVN